MLGPVVRQRVEAARGARPGTAVESLDVGCYSAASMKLTAALLFLALAGCRTGQDTPQPTPCLSDCECRADRICHEGRCRFLVVVRAELAGPSSVGGDAPADAGAETPEQQRQHQPQGPPPSAAHVARAAGSGPHAAPPLGAPTAPGRTSPMRALTWSTRTRMATRLRPPSGTITSAYCFVGWT